MALYSFDDYHRRFPLQASTDPSGIPTTSWRYEICRYFSTAEPPGIQVLDVPWDSPKIRHWEMWGASHYSGSSHDPFTTILAVTGQGAAFGKDKARLKAVPNDLIIVVEVSNAGVHWMQPGDYDAETLQQDIVNGNFFAGDGACVGFADGETWLLSNATPPAEIGKFLTIDGAKNHDRDSSLASFVIRRWSEN